MFKTLIKALKSKKTFLFSLLKVNMERSVLRKSMSPYYLHYKSLKGKVVTGSEATQKKIFYQTVSIKGVQLG